MSSDKRKSGPARRAVIVLGMHRSGTSALTRVINLLGADITSHLMPENKFNETGYWESQELYEINEKLLEHLNANWTISETLSKSWIKSKEASHYINQISQVLKKDFDDSKLFVIKDPRFCILFPVIHEALKRINATPYVIVTIRHPHEVALSLLERDQISLAVSYRIWLRHLLDAEKYTRNIKRCFISYDSLLADWRRTIRKITKSLEINWPNKTTNIERDVNKFIQPKLKHFSINNKPSVDFDIPAWVDEVHKIFIDFCDSEISNKEIIRLNGIKSSLDKADMLFSPIIKAYQNEKNNYASVYDKKKSEFDELSETLNRAKSELEDNNKEINRLNERISQGNQHIDMLEEKIINTKTEMGAYVTTIEALRGEANKRDIQIESLGEKLISAQSDIDVQMEKIKNLADEKVKSDDQIRKLEEKLHTAQSVLDSHVTKITALDNEIKDRDEQIKKHKKMLGVMQSKLGKSTSEISKLVFDIKELGNKSNGYIEKIGKLEKELSAKNNKMSAFITRFSENQEESKTLKRIIKSLGYKAFSSASGNNSIISEELSLIGYLSNRKKRIQRRIYNYITLNRGEKKKARGEKEIIEVSDLFDSTYYTAMYPELFRQGYTPLDHFIYIGAQLNYWPNQLFDTEYYKLMNPDIAEAGINPLLHYIEYGVSEGRNPHPLFDTKYYLNKYGDVYDSGINPLKHFLKYGAYEERNPHPMFNTKYYLSQDKDIKKLKLNPLIHYLEFGYLLGYRPNFNFDTQYYLERNPEILNAGINPLIHYIQKTKTQGEDFWEHNNINFHSKKNNLLEGGKNYSNPDQSGMSIFSISSSYLARAPLDFNKVFRPVEYLEENREIQKLIDNGEYESPLAHFLLVGMDEIQQGKRKLYGRLSYYNEADYLSQNPDVNEAVGRKEYRNGFEHYLHVGHKEILDNIRPDILNDNYSLEIALSEQIDYKDHIENLTVPYFDKILVSVCVYIKTDISGAYQSVSSVINNIEELAYELIIVGDTSSTAVNELNQYLENVKIVDAGKSTKLVKHINNIVDHATGENVLVINTDMIGQKDWIKNLSGILTKSTSVKLAGPKILNKNGSLNTGGKIIWKDGKITEYGCMDNPMKPEYSYYKEVDVINENTFMINKKIWNELDGFDQTYRISKYCLADYSQKLRRSGYKVIYQPESIVVNIRTSSNREIGVSGEDESFDQAKFVKRWRKELSTRESCDYKHIFKARDRSLNKKHMLIIDHYVPHYDKDAGSKTMWQYIDLFINKNISLTFVGDNFFKHQPYVNELEKKGVEILYGPYYYNHFDYWFRHNGINFDYIYLLRPHIAIKYLNLVKNYSSAKLFYNSTDFHFLRLEREYKLKNDPDILTELERVKEMEFTLFENVDVVLTISDYERKIFNELFPGKQIEVIPTYIYDSVFPISNQDYEHRDGIMFVGGFNHKPNLDGMTWFLSSIWPIVKNRNPQLKFYIIGSNIPDELRELASGNIEFKNSISEEELNQCYDSAKLVIAPMTYGAGVKGKVIEGIAHGVPVITTTIGAEGIFDADKVLNIVDSPEKFANNILEIHDNKFLWESMREISIKYAGRYLSYSSANDVINRIL